MPLTNHVRRYREAAGLSLQQLGREVEVDRAFLHKIERAVVPCPDALKLRLARHFGVAVGDLFFQSSQSVNA